MKLSEYKIAIAQINTTVGDLEGNANKIIKYIKVARQSKAHLLIFPELTITGYPPKDLLLKPAFIQKNKNELKRITKHTEGIGAIVGFVDFTLMDQPISKNIYDIPSIIQGQYNLYNAAALIQHRHIVGIQYKTHLPNYDVFDERRYFDEAKVCNIFELDGLKLGINICEDIWVDNGPTEMQAKKDAQFIVNISASPFYAGKTKIRRDLIAKRARENHIPIVYVNLVGGQDDLVFDGGSYVFNREGNLIAKCAHFKEDQLVTGLEARKKISVKDDIIENIHDALVLGIRDYVRKNGFNKVVIGLSGGIDSALTAALAVKALGAESVLGVLMPSKISSISSVGDSKKLAQNLGIGYKTIPIAETYDAYIDTLSNEFKNTKPDVTEQNIQARIRGNILMALSNKFGYLVLSTGNKSELAVGYTTLYGDMAGGLATISDVPKTKVYELSNYINRVAGKDIIPKCIINKEPSAELEVGQKDSDDLPPYKILDPILHYYIEENKSKDEIMALGFDEALVSDIIYRVDHNEYKRKQTSIGIKITPKAFGFGRRMPITNKFKG
jgi:NAD+ synthase (glutamine-hydrolysing)